MLYKVNHRFCLSVLYLLGDETSLLFNSKILITKKKMKVKGLITKVEIIGI